MLYAEMEVFPQIFKIFKMILWNFGNLSLKLGVAKLHGGWGLVVV